MTTREAKKRSEFRETAEACDGTLPGPEAGRVMLAQMSVEADPTLVRADDGRVGLGESELHWPGHYLADVRITAPSEIAKCRAFVEAGPPPTLSRVRQLCRGLPAQTIRLPPAPC